MRSKRLSIVSWLLLNGGFCYSQTLHSQVVSVSINGSDATGGAYFCWAPVLASIKLSAPTESDVPVSISSRGTASLVFQAGSRPSKATFAPKDSLQLMLPKNGGAALFSVAGKWGRASEAHEDTHIVVSSNGTIVAELPVTVRVRKDAEKLTADERKRLLKSVIELEKGGWFNRYAALHNVAGHLVHSTSEQRNYIFLAWHRTLLLDLERRLQQVDPAIAIPYWRFETATPSIFSSGFLGEVPRDSDSSEVEFEPPMDAFRVAFAFNPVWWRDGRLLRDVVTNDWASGGWLPSDRVQANVEAIMQAAAYPIAGELIQRNFHLGVHNKIGYYMSNPETAAVDPVFYLLHANVDHLWARWQRAAAGRETPDTDVGFYPRGRYRDGCCGTNQQPRTAFGDEPLWPWNFRTGPNSDVTGPWADPPDGTLRIPFPGAAGFGPIHEEPLAKEMVDYLDEAGVGASLGFCYDDIGF